MWENDYLALAELVQLNRNGQIEISNAQFFIAGSLIRQACSSQYLSKSTKIITNTETAMLSKSHIQLTIT